MRTSEKLHLRNIAVSPKLQKAPERAFLHSSCPSPPLIPRGKACPAPSSPAPSSPRESVPREPISFLQFRDLVPRGRALSATRSLPHWIEFTPKNTRALLARGGALLGASTKSHGETMRRKQSAFRMSRGNIPSTTKEAPSTNARRLIFTVSLAPQFQKTRPHTAIKRRTKYRCSSEQANAWRSLQFRVRQPQRAGAP